LHQWISRALQPHGFLYEIILVDDGSGDGSWAQIQAVAQSDDRIKGIKFLRNYGKSAALNMGFRHASGATIITMDADLQDSPEEIPELHQMIQQEGFDLVSGWKKKRKDPISKTVPSKLFNFVTRKISGIPLHDFNCGLKAYRAAVVKQIDIYGEMHRYIPAIAKWSGFNKIGEKVVEHHPRKYGTTKFGFERFIYGFLDLLSVTFVSKFKKRPMHFFGTMGTFSFIFGFVITCWIIGQKIYYNWWLHQTAPRDVVDQPVFFLALVLLVVGVQLFLAGFISEMITINATKRDDYLVEDKVGMQT
ncbi:MAG: glycosyltransferase family 2 protein, partial [Cyclobacteriaceae bacterium]